MTDLEKVLGKTGARKLWNKVWGNVKILTGDVAYNTKGDLQTQINAVADTASTAKTTADAAKTAAEDAKVAAGEIVTDTTDKFDSTKDYAVGDYVIYDNKAWKFTTVHPAGAWDESHVEQTNILAEIAAQNKNFEALTENLTEYVSMKYVSTGDSDVHIKFKIIDTSQLRAYITALITSQSGQPVMLTVSINIENNTIKSWNQITPINNSFGIQSVNIEEGGIQVKFNSVGVWGVCQYWGTGISI